MQFFPNKLTFFNVDLKNKKLIKKNVLLFLVPSRIKIYIINGVFVMFYFFQ